MVSFLLIGVGGFAGALARYGLGSAVQRLSGPFFPAGTLFVNVVGCFLLGVVMALVPDRPFLSTSAETRAFLAIGFLGSFTTFSTFGWETMGLLRDGRVLAAAANAGLSLLLGLAAIWLGAAAVGVLSK